MFKKIELLLLENHANVSVEFDENNSSYSLTLMEYESKETGDTTSYDVKNKTVVYLDRDQIVEVIRMLEYSLSIED